MCALERNEGNTVARKANPFKEWPALILLGFFPPFWLIGIFVLLFAGLILLLARPAFSGIGIAEQRDNFRRELGSLPYWPWVMYRHYNGQKKAELRRRRRRK